MVRKPARRSRARPREATLDEALHEPVLRGVDDTVDPLEDSRDAPCRGHRVGYRPALATVEALDVEVDPQDEREYGERGERETMLARQRAERCEQGRVDE